MFDRSIRLALLDDLETVKRIVDAAYSKWIPVIGDKPLPMLADYSTLISSGFTHVVIENGQMIAVLVIWPLDGDDALYIDNIAVHPEHQKRGIGDYLLNFAAQQARQAGLNMLRLVTNEKMEYNQAYYRKHGFVETRRDLTPEGRRVVWMHKPVN